MSDFKIDSATTRAAGRPKDPEKRDAILNAAARLFLEHGFDRTSMDAIANAAGVSKLTVYSHFDDKDGLFKELIRHKCDQYFENRDVSQLNDLPPQDALTKMANGFLGLMFNPETLAMYRLLMSNAARDPARNQTFYDTGPAPTIESLSRLLNSYNERGLLKVDNPKLAADHFLAMLQGCMHLRSLLNIAPSPSAHERKEYVDDAVAVFLRAYAVDSNLNSSAAKNPLKKQSVRRSTDMKKKKR